MSQSSEDLALGAYDLSKSYGDLDALREVSIEASCGEVVGLLGMNGAGKTTLLSIIAGLLRPDAGVVQTAPGLEVGLVPQELAIWPPVTVDENLRFVAEACGRRGRALRTAVDDALEGLLLTAARSRLARTLSGGEKRRLHVALTMVARGDILLLDEPTANCDPASRSHLLKLFRSLASEGRAVVYSTHYLDEVEELCSRMVVLHDGSVLACGTVESLVAEHGETAVEIRFGEPPMSQDLGVPARWVTPTTARVSCDDPALAARELLAGLGDVGSPVESIEFVRPTLEHAFLSLIGSTKSRSEMALDVD